MKSFFKIIAAAGLAFTMASCAANDPYGNNNPNNYPNNGTVYRTSDGTVYRRGDVYRDNSGNVYQNGRIIRNGDVTGQPGVLGRNGTNYPDNARRLPPGQAKKVYGGDAKDYAPGQTKKRRQWNNGTYNDDHKYKDKKHKNKREHRDHDDND